MMDVDRIVEDQEENVIYWDSDWGDADWNGLDEFRAACAKFTVANQHLASWSTDYTRKVRVRDAVTA